MLLKIEIDRYRQIGGRDLVAILPNIFSCKEEKEEFLGMNLSREENDSAINRFRMGVK